MSGRDSMKDRTYLEKDYNRIKKKYNLKKINSENRFLNKFIKNESIVGHWNLNGKTNDVRTNKLAVITGFSLSGKLHLGNKLALDIANSFSKKGAKLFISISDSEAILTRNSPKVINTYFNAFTKDLTKSDISLRKAEIYLHSDNKKVQSLLLKILRILKYSDFKRIYGKNIDLPEIFAISNMMADVFYPFDKGYRQAVVILGIDEIKHAESIIFLSKKLRLEEPIFLFTKILNGLKKGKMSKSKEEENILISDKPKLTKRKLIKKSLTRKFKNICDEPAYQIARWCLNISKKKLDKLSKDLSYKEFVNHIGSRLEGYYKNGFK